MDVATTGSERIIARIASGAADEADWRALVERHGEPMRRAAALAIGPGALVDDAVQEAFLQLRRCAGSFRPRSGEADTEADACRWLQRLTINCALPLRRAERRRLRRESAYAESLRAEEAMRDDHGGDASWHEQLGQAMERLSQDDRTVLLLRHAEGLDHRGLALALGTNEAAARKRLSRAHEQLRRHWAKLGGAVSLAVVAGRLDAACGAALPPQPVAAWVHAAASGKPPLLAAHLVSGGISAMAIATAVGIPLLAAALVAGALAAAGPAPAGRQPPAPPAPAGESPAPVAAAPVVAWKQPAAGTQAWSVAANWTAAVPDAAGVTADLTGMPGDTVITVDRPITLGALLAGPANGAVTVIRGEHPLTFAAATPGAPTRIDFRLGAKPTGMRLDIACGIRLGGGSPLTATLAGATVFECWLGSVDLGANTFTVAGPRRYQDGELFGASWTIGSLAGTGSYVQDGAGTVLQQASRGFTGTLTIDNGDFTAAQGLPTVPRIVLAGAHGISRKYPTGGKLTLGSPADAKGLPARLAPDAVLVFKGGFLHDPGPRPDEAEFLGATRPVAVERIAQMQFLCALSQLQLENGNEVCSSSTLLATDPVHALVRRQGATVMIGGDDIRSKQAMFYSTLGTAEKLIFASGMAEHLKGAGGPPGSKTRSIIPWVTIGTMYHPAQGLMATYDPADGIRALRRQELDRVLQGSPDRNVLTGTLSLGAHQRQTVNAVIYDSWSNSDIGAGSVLTITSGFLQFYGGAPSSIGDTPGAGGTIDFGPAEGVLWTGMGGPWGPNKLGAVIAGSGGLTTSGTAVLILKGANTYTGRTCIGAGVIQVGDGTVTGAKLGDGDVEVANGAILRIKAKVANAIADDATVTLLDAGPAFHGVLDLDAGIDERVGGLVLADEAQPPGTYGGKDSAAAHQLDQWFTGKGVLTVTGRPTVKPAVKPAAAP